MIRGTSSAMSAPSVAFVAPPATPTASLPELKTLAPIDQAPTAGALSNIQQGAGIAAVVACGAGAAMTGRRRRQRATNKVMIQAFESELGVQAPVGFWDPLGFSKDGDVEDFKRRRETELKHGRVSMFAVMGYITPEYYKFPGYLSTSAGIKFSDVPNGLAAINKVPIEGWLQWVALCGFYEIVVNQPQNADEPGNYGRGWLGFSGESMTDPEKRKRSLNSELANGRLAMVAIMGMMFQNGWTGTTGPEMWFPASASASSVSPVALRAGPKVLEGTGGPMPNDFWDPAGLAKGKSDEQLLHWRAVELKHGRVAMLAILGWTHVAAGWHPIGDGAARTRVSDNPLEGAAQLPIGGAFQVVFFIMCCEWLITYVCKPPADKPWDILGWSDVIADEDFPDWKENQLKELNNGRLAMFAILGLIAQTAYTGDYGNFGAPPFEIPEDWGKYVLPNRVMP